MARLLRNVSILKRSTPKRCLLGSSSQISSFSTKGKKKSRSDGSDSGEENMSKKDIALKQAIDQINTSHGKGSIMFLGQCASPRQVPVVSTGSFALDIALGVGGFPKGRVVEIYGPEASGKTTLALHVIAEAQKQGGYCVFVDAEHALDPSLAEAIGVNTKDLLLSQPDSGEQALSLVAALVPKSELDGEMGDAHMAMQARLMSQALRKLSHSLSLSQTILIFINQVRSKLQTFGFGAPSEVTCGGNALKFYASIRLNIRRIGLVKKGEETLGSQILVKIMKNKLAPPYRTAQFELEFGKGICRESELIELGLKHKFIMKAGAYYSMGDMKFCGKDAFKRYLAENLTIRDELETKLREKLIEGPKMEKDAETTDAEDIVSTDEEVTAVEA
ncbi:DNA recombination and repair protein RecA [Cynara cardunculus var. scolymus]|uniref:DNA recombination and repair protein RecA n=1 Tax=Cynara cardunculus var. scolymus TaxID=59895 RepID=A0A124SIB6_CYNCS|nr:DNA recombination and repair protein RecA [Cynara cardunculus var. scolymus]